MNNNSKRNELDININLNVQDFRSNPDRNQISSTIDKLKSNVSVSQLALFYRLPHDHEAVSVKNQTDILKFIAANFYTDNSPDISPRSLRSKYYSIDLATRESVKLMLSKSFNTRMSNYKCYQKYIGAKKALFGLKSVPF